MTEWEKAQAGRLYDANNDAALLEKRRGCAALCHAFNLTDPLEEERQQQLLRKIFGRIGENSVVTAPFYCDYGTQITLGDHFYANHNCVILDAAPVRIGSHVFIGPNCVLTTSGHPIDAPRRDAGLEFALPITLGDHVWLGASVTVLPGVTIGDGAVIGAGSVVTRDIPPNVVAAGNPCRVLRPITAADREARSE